MCIQAQEVLAQLQQRLEASLVYYKLFFYFSFDKSFGWLWMNVFTLHAEAKVSQMWFFLMEVYICTCVIMQEIWLISNLWQCIYNQNGRIVNLHFLHLTSVHKHILYVTSQRWHLIVW